MKLKRLLQSTPWTCASLGQACDVAEPTISRISTGAREASLALAFRIELATEGKVAAHELPLSAYSRKTLKLLNS